MLKEPYNYNVYFDFIDAYLPSGFLNINANDPIMLELEDYMELNDQLLIVMDLTQTKIIYTSKRSTEMLGIDPAENNTLEMMSRVHPDDLHRFGLGRAKLMNIDKDLYINHSGAAFLSTNVKMLKPNKKYAEHLFQCYMFFSPIPHKSVYYIQVNTNIDWYNMKKDHFHYYVGDDISMFKFPDDDLLKIGHQLTKREFEIIELIADGNTSEQIAEKLFLSKHTVDTHRRNILTKSEKAHLSDYIYNLKDQGLL